MIVDITKFQLFNTNNTLKKNSGSPEKKYPFMDPFDPWTTGKNSSVHGHLYVDNPGVTCFEQTSIFFAYGVQIKR